MNKQDLEHLFRNGAKILDDKKQEIGRGLRECILLQNGFEKAELRKLVKQGVLEKVQCRNNYDEKDNFSYGPIVNVYVLKP